MPGLKRDPLRALLVIFLAAVLPTAAEAQAPPSPEPDVLVISEPVLAAFEKGLRTEIALRAAFRKELGALKTKAEYQKCYGEAATSPDAMKVVESMTSIPENATMGQRQRRMERMAQRMEALVLKQCGVDPGQFGDRWRAERLKEIEARAADAAGPLP